MDWDDITNVVYDGFEDDYKSLICPDCGGVLTIDRSDQGASIECTKCGTICRTYFGRSK